RPCLQDHGQLDQVDDRAFVGRRRWRGSDLLGAGAAPWRDSPDHQPREPGRRLRPRLCAEHRAREEDLGGDVEWIRLRRHQRHPGVPQDLNAPAPPAMPRVRTLPADVDLLALHRLAPARWPLLLESVAGGKARWDLQFATDGSGLRLDPDGVTRDLQGNPLAGNFLDLLDAAWRRERVPPRRNDDGLPF